MLLKATRLRMGEIPLLETAFFNESPPRLLTLQPQTRLLTAQSTHRTPGSRTRAQDMRVAYSSLAKYRGYP
jgi:hypothetical protein